MVLIRECDEIGWDIAPVTSEEKSRLWMDSMRHAKRHDGLINWNFFRRGTLVTRC